MKTPYIKELQMWHASENKNINLLLCNVRGTLLRKIKCSNDNVSLQLWILTWECRHFMSRHSIVYQRNEKLRKTYGRSYSFVLPLCFLELFHLHFIRVALFAWGAWFAWCVFAHSYCMVCWIRWCVFAFFFLVFQWEAQ